MRVLFHGLPRHNEILVLFLASVPLGERKRDCDTTLVFGRVGASAVITAAEIHQPGTTLHLGRNGFLQTRATIHVPFMATRDDQRATIFSREVRAGE
ncbi:hypothetical protein D3C85_1542540 [compost metagenome]